jgi:ParB family chromosome partitioning protein
MKVNIHLIIPNPDQPRTIFDQAELEGLAQSIEENGLIQPIVVEQAGDQYILIDGERRWRACQLAGLKQIEVVVRPSSNHNGLDRLTKALVANIQRSAMGPVDEGRAFERLMKEFGTLSAVAQKVGVSHATVSSKLALLDFPEPVQKIYNLRRLPLDTSTIAAMKRLNAEQQLRIATQAASRGWSGQTMLRLIALEQKGSHAYVPTKRTKKEIHFDGHFNALALINGKKLPESIRAAAVRTCEACSLYPEASPAICKECPLPDFLRRVETTKKAME